MKKHLFLCGPAGCGKSRLLREELGPALAMAGGYVTEASRDESGKITGVDLLPAAAAGGIEGFEALRFLDMTCVPPKRDNEVFRGPAVQLLQEAEYYPFSVIDEFGGFEMVIPQYRQQLAAFLSSDQPCVGVLKTTEEAQKARDLFGLGEKYTMLIQNLHQVLAQDSDTVLLKTSGCGDETARRILRQWIKEFVNG